MTLLLLLIPITWRMLQKAHSLYKKENAQKKVATLVAASSPDETAQAQEQHPPTHNPLHRLSETLSNLARNSTVISDEVGPGLGNDGFLV